MPRKSAKPTKEDAPDAEISTSEALRKHADAIQGCNAGSVTIQVEIAAALKVIADALDE